MSERGRASEEKAREILSCLSQAEMEVFLLIVSDHSTAEIAEKRGTTVKTAEHQRAKVCGKLGTRSLVKLTKLAIRAGVTSCE